MKYKIELTEKQMRVVKTALEEYFRIRLGQMSDVANDLAFMNVEISGNTPEHAVAFNNAIVTRDHLTLALEAAYKMAFPYPGITKKTDNMEIAECIWDAIRVALGISRWGDMAFQVGPEPWPTIEKLEDDKNVK